MRRFFIDENAVSEGTVTIKGNLFCHMTRVLRLKIGTRVILCDGVGRSHTGIIEAIGRESLSVRLEESSSEQAPPERPFITLYQGLPKGSKMEFILQKNTELGADAFVPFVSERSVAKLPRDRESERLERWRKIILEAARQSGRAILPALSPVMNLSEALAASDQELKILLWEEEKGNRLKSVFGSRTVPKSVAVIVGPEGGLSAEEASAAAAAGFIPVSFGPRILRTETAGIALTAILQFYWGDMG